MDQPLKFTSPSMCALSLVAMIFSPSCLLSKVRRCRMAGRALHIVGSPSGCSSPRRERGSLGQCWLGVVGSTHTP